MEGQLSMFCIERRIIEKWPSDSQKAKEIHLQFLANIKKSLTMFDKYELLFTTDLVTFSVPGCKMLMVCFEVPKNVSVLTTQTI